MDVRAVPISGSWLGTAARLNAAAIAGV